MGSPPSVVIVREFCPDIDRQLRALQILLKPRKTAKKRMARVAESKSEPAK